MCGTKSDLRYQRDTVPVVVLDSGCQEENYWTDKYCILHFSFGSLHTSLQSISQVSVFPVIATNKFAPTCQWASFTGSFLSTQTFPTFSSHTTWHMPMWGLQPEWKPGVCPGPVAHISHFCKPCHSISRMSKLEVCLSLFPLNLFFPGSALLEDHLLWEAQKQSKTDSSQTLVKCLKRQYFKHGWWWVQFVCSLLWKKST